MNSLHMIFKYWTYSRKRFIKYVLFQMIATIFALFIPIFIGNLVGQLDPNLPKEQQATPFTLLINFIIIVIFGIVAYFISRGARISGAKIAARALFYIRQDIHDAIYRQSYSYFDKYETGQLIARATSDVEQTEGIFGMGLVLGIMGILQLIGVNIATWSIQPKLAWILTICIPLSIIGSLIITKKLKPIYQVSREAFGDLTNTIRENIVGAQVVRMFGTQKKEFDKFSVNNERFRNISILSAKYNSFFMPLNILLLGLMIILTLYFGGTLILNNEMSLALLITFQSYIGMAIFPLVMLGNIFIMYVQADAALTRIREVLESTPDIIEDPDPITKEKINGDIIFDHVSFGYTPTNLILNDMNFHIIPGQKVAILGTTGSGKSTIINLLPRFYDVSKGRILIDNVDVRKYKINNLRRHIGIVSQDTYLFDKTIKQNIAFGKDSAIMEEIELAAEIAGIKDFIEGLPEKYETMVGERGMNLSGGQKQRLSIARALIINPKILILDDSTSSVDVETEYQIQQALERVMNNTTTFIITQRISTIRNADAIMVLDKGRIVGFGTHEELYHGKNGNANPLYRQIFETLQLKQKKEN